MARRRISKTRRNPSDPARRTEASKRLTRIKQAAFQRRIDAAAERAAQLSEKAGRGAAYARVGVGAFPLTAVVVTAVIAGFIGYKMGQPSTPTA